MDKPFRVAIFSHGFSDHRNCYTGQTTELASQGIIVLSIEHYEKIFLEEFGTCTFSLNADISRQIRAKRI